MRQHREFCKICDNKNDSKQLCYCKSCYNAYKRNHYLKNREKEIIRCSIWNKNNKEKVAANMRACRQRRPEHFLDYKKTWGLKNRDRVRIYDHNKKIKRKWQIGNKKIDLISWNLIKEKHHQKCFYCSCKTNYMTIDHYIPLSRGGEHIIENIVPACKKCNSQKTHLMPEEFIKRKGFKNVRARITQKSDVARKRTWV